MNWMDMDIVACFGTDLTPCPLSVDNQIEYNYDVAYVIGGQSGF